MSPAPILIPPLSAAAATASERLAVAIAAEPSWAVPCVADGGGDWLSDHAPAIDRAIAGCEGCPVLALCEQHGIATHAEGVVLAGRRWTRWTAKNLARDRKTNPAATAAGADERKSA